MFRLLARRLATWSCLALGLLSALTPAQGVVLCVEPEGGVRIEDAFGAACCAERAGAGGEAATDAPRDVSPAARTLPISDCACIDIPLASGTDQRRECFRAGLPDAQRLLMLQPAATALRLDVRESSRVALAEIPRAAPPLVVERSVVLLV